MRVFVLWWKERWTQLERDWHIWSEVRLPDSEGWSDRIGRLLQLLHAALWDGLHLSFGTLWEAFFKNLCWLSYPQDWSLMCFCSLAPSFMPFPPASNSSPLPTQTFSPFFSPPTSLLSLVYWNKCANTVGFENVMTISIHWLQNDNFPNENVSFFPGMNCRN